MYTMAEEQIDTVLGLGVETVENEGEKVGNAFSDGKQLKT